MSERKKRINLKGEKFGLLTVLERDKDKLKHWKCICDCGNYTSVHLSNLKSGNTKSCGCISRQKVSQRRMKDLTGQRFGRLTAIERTDKKTNSGCYLWECICDCGNTCLVGTSSLLQQLTKSCGCLRRKLNVNERISDYICNKGGHYLVETRKARLAVNKSGGTAGKGGVTFRVTLPTAWVREMELGEDSREIELAFDGEKIEITKKPGA